MKMIHSQCSLFINHGRPFTFGFIFSPYSTYTFKHTHKLIIELFISIYYLISIAGDNKTKQKCHFNLESNNCCYIFVFSNRQIDFAIYRFFSYNLIGKLIFFSTAIDLTAPPLLVMSHQSLDRLNTHVSFATTRKIIIII